MRRPDRVDDTTAAQRGPFGSDRKRKFKASRPDQRVHLCFFGVLALESEPVDPPL
jgi:hypothetical protein